MKRILLEGNCLGFEVWGIGGLGDWGLAEKWGYEKKRLFVAEVKNFEFLEKAFF